ncbi:MAG: hypothetical protein LBI33_02885 [Propionibacteriaceae bacterium]|jgi:L-fucose mutarotase|nr:hypothetical protein [Propionibacteriaceae bacterium]
MLKGLDPYLTPDLLGALAEMGHGDHLALVDRNFPAYAHDQLVIQLPHSRMADVLRAILQVFPIDAFAHSAVTHMLTDDGDEGPALPICRETWNLAENREVADRGLRRHGPAGFYALASEAFVVVQTGETLPYACFLLPKGVI